MKKFTTQEIRDLYNRFFREEISFSRMVEIMNEMVSEFKDGDFVAGFGCIFILHKQIDKYSAQYNVWYERDNGRLHYYKTYSQLGGIDELRHATEGEKQELLDALAKEGKRWNEEKKCVEDIPVRKFKVGDKVRIKYGVSSKTHRNISPTFLEEMDELIGKTMTVSVYTHENGYVICNEYSWRLNEEWLEPYVEELKKGDLAIFWNLDKWEAFVGKYNGLLDNGSSFPHQDHRGNRWVNAIKFESREQYEQFIKREI